MFKDDFEGTGNLKKFCDETNKLFSAINNIVFTMPSEYAGVEPSVTIEKDRIVFDFGSCLVFTLSNVQWHLKGTADFSSYEVSVTDGKLHIYVTANSVCAP